MAELPQEITKETLHDVLQVGKDLTAPKEAENDFETLLGYIERFAGHFERIKGTVAQLRGIEQPSAQIQQTNQSQQHEIVESVKTVEVGRIDPLHLYQIALGYLAQCPPEMKAGEILEMARNMKPIVMAKIKEELDTYYDSLRQ